MRFFAAASISIAMAMAAMPAAAQTRAPADSGGAAADSARLARLEQQIADLQGVVAAVETLAKSSAGGGSGYAAAAGGGASSGEIRQLSEQIADLTQRIERLEARLGEGGGGSPSPGLHLQQRGDADFGAPPASGFEDKQQLPPLGAPPGQAYAPGQQKQSAVAPAPAAGGSSSSPARALFDKGYGALNRHEYTAAEGYFQQFLDEYPSDPLAGKAQYWYGEAAFVSGEYRTAADRFLKTFTNYPSSERAAEALLKLAISLRRLGNRSDACATFAELAQRYPEAPQSVMRRAASEKKRANCG
jgi:tol-pal system protein YbgF